MIQLMSSLILAYSALIISIGIFSLIPYIKRNTNLKRTEFTQRIIEQHKDVPRMISKIINSQLKEHHFEGGAIDETDLMSIQKGEEGVINDTYILLNIFNTFADGIDRGVYDEDLIRINFEQDIKFFYRYSGPYLRNLRFSSDSDEMFLPIEFLIKEWENNKPKKKRVRFFG